MMKKCLLVMSVFCFISTLVPNVFAGFTNPVLLEELNDSSIGENAGAPCLSSDGLKMYFHRQNSSGISQLVAAQRDIPNGVFTSERILTELTTNNMKVYDPWVSNDGLRLYYRRYYGGQEGYKLRVSQRNNTSETWDTGVTTSFSQIHVNPLNDWSPSLISDELTIFYASQRTGSNSIWSASRTSILDQSGDTMQFSDAINLTELGTGDIRAPFALADGLVIYFSAIRDSQSSWDIYRAQRDSLNEQFTDIQRLSICSDDFNERGVYVTPDESEIYFSNELGIWHAVVPEPATALLLACGAVSLIRKRRA